MQNGQEWQHICPIRWFVFHTPTRQYSGRHIGLQLPMLRPSASKPLNGQHIASAIQGLYTSLIAAQTIGIPYYYLLSTFPGLSKTHKPNVGDGSTHRPNWGRMPVQAMGEGLCSWEGYTVAPSTMCPPLNTPTTVREKNTQRADAPLTHLIQPVSPILCLGPCQ